VLSPDEAEVLVSHFGKKKATPATELTIGQAVLWIGRLGGHLNAGRTGPHRCGHPLGVMRQLGFAST
jgi:hypothetical protein